MASITVDIPDALKEFLDRKAKSGRFKTSKAFVQTLIVDAVRSQWQREADDKLRESLREYERGEGVPWQMGDCEKMVRDYLKKKNQKRRKKA